MAPSKNQPATKQDIDNLYKKIKGEFLTKDDSKAFATKEDLKNELRGYATKEDLKDELRRFATKEDLEDFREEIKSGFTGFKSEILNLIDSVLVELKAIRENQEVHDFSHSRINDELSDHETRLGKIEKSPASPLV